MKINTFFATKSAMKIWAPMLCILLAASCRNGKDKPKPSPPLPIHAQYDFDSSEKSTPGISGKGLSLKGKKAMQVAMPSAEELKHGFTISMWLRMPKLEKERKCVLASWKGVFEIYAKQRRWSKKPELHATFDTDKGKHVFYTGPMLPYDKWIFLTLTHNPEFKKNTGIVNLSVYGIPQAPLGRFVAHAQFGVKNHPPKDYIVGSGVQGEIVPKDNFLYISSSNKGESFGGDIDDLRIVKRPMAPSELMNEWIDTCRREKLKLPAFFFPKDPAKNEILTAQSITTFNSAGLYVTYKGSHQNQYKCAVSYRKNSEKKWRKGMDLIKDETTQEFRGSLLNLQADKTYEIKCELSSPGKKEASSICMLAKTWSENPPIGETVTIPSGISSSPLFIKNVKGKPDSWILYAPEKGKKSEIDVGHDKTKGIYIENSKYVIVRGISVRGGSEMGVGVANSHHIRLQGLDISKWGRPMKIKKGMKEGLYVDKITGKYIYQKFGLKIYDGSSQVVSENCFIHQPLGGSHCWAYGHPRGPNAIGLERTGGNNVIRNNNVIGSDTHRFDDCLVSSPNHYVWGGAYHDTDINGNTFAFANDDGTELDGGQMNVRYWNNKISDTLCGISGAPCLKGPSYIFRNLISSLGDKRGRSVSPFKMGGQQFPYNGLSHVFHNTASSQSRAMGADFWRHRKGDVGRILSRNNIFTDPTGSGGFIYYATTKEIGDFDYDMIPEYPFKIKENKKGMSKAPSGCETNAVIAGPAYSDISAGDFNLKKNSPGINKGIILAGINDNHHGKAPDIGAIEYIPEKPFENFPTRANGITVKPQQVTLEYIKTKGSNSTKITLTAPLSAGSKWEAVPNSPWIKCNPASGNISGKNQELTISIDAKGMPVRPYRGAVTFRSDKGICRTLFVNMTVHPEKAFSETIEAEDGQISGGFKKLNEGGANGGKCISPQHMQGKAEYSFSVPETGTYFLHARVMLESRKNSMHDLIQISVDGGEKITCEFKHKAFNKWDWKAIKNPRRLVPGPHPWTLKKGKHILTISPKSGKIKIDALRISSSPKYKGSLKPYLFAKNKKDRPDSFFVESGFLKVRFDSKKGYNMNRIEYKGKTLCIDKAKSHYGTVINFPGIGFIGSGHTENETEEATKLEIFSDGKKIDINKLKNNETIKAENFEFIRHSNIHGIKLQNTIRIKDNIIHECASLGAAKKTRLAFMYNFMHPWSTKLTEYAVKTKDGKIERGAFNESEKFYVDKEMIWAALYSPAIKTGIVSKLTSAWKGTKSVARLWDRKCYHKFYFRSFFKQDFPADTEAKFQLSTSFFESEPDNWLERAKESCDKKKPGINNLSGKEGTLAIDIIFTEELENGKNSSNKSFNIITIDGMAELSSGCNKSQTWIKWNWELKQENGKKAIGMNLLLPEIKAHKPNALLFTWNASKGFFDVYLNGYPARTPQTSLPVWKSSKAHECKITKGPFEILSLKSLPSYTPPDKVAEMTKTGQGNPFIKTKLPSSFNKLLSQKGELIYDGEKNDPEFKTWIKEGPAKCEFKNGWEAFKSANPENGKNGHIVWWCPKEFPDSFIAEWEVKILSEHGLCIAFFAARGINGESIFDEKLPNRDGTFAQYTKGKIKSYHISYHTNSAHNPGRPQINLRKNNSFYLLTQGASGFTADKKPHTVVLIKKKNRITMAIDGEPVLEYEDNNIKRFGEPHTDGWFGLRQMSWAIGEYRNFKAWELK